MDADRERSDKYLSRREQQLIEILYKESPLTASEIEVRLPDAPTNATVRKLLRILEEKGHIRHEEIEGKFVYYPTHPREEAGRHVLKNAVETFFAGSMAKTVAALLTGGQQLSEAEMLHIQELLCKAKEEKR